MKITRSALKNLIKEEMSRMNEDMPGDQPLADDPSLQGSQTTLSGAEVPQYMFHGMEREQANTVVQGMGRRNGFGPRRWMGGADYSGHKVEVEGLQELAPQLYKYSWWRPVELNRGLEWGEDVATRRSDDDDLRVMFSVKFYVTSDEWKNKFSSDPIDEMADNTAYVTAKVDTVNNLSVKDELGEWFLNDFNAQNAGRGAKIVVDGKSDLPFTLSWTWEYKTGV